MTLQIQMLGGDSSVGIVANYGLDGLWIKFFWWRDSRNPLWDPQTLLYSINPFSFPGVKWPGRGVDHAPASRT